MPDADYSLYYVTGPVPDGVDFFASLEQACQGGADFQMFQLEEALMRYESFAMQVVSRWYRSVKRPLLPVIS
jgi:hypothetical protein